MKYLNYSSIATSALRRKALSIVKAGVDAIETTKVIRERVRVKKKILSITNVKNKVMKYDLTGFENIYLVGFGKASALMAKEISKKIMIKKGIVIATKKEKIAGVKVIVGTHPEPSIKNKKGTKEIMDLVSTAGAKDLVICLISGGGSALLYQPTCSHSEYMSWMKNIFSSGIDIKALNTIRKKKSLVKGGKLAKLTKAKIVSLIFSDVIGDDLGTIASGPTYGAKNADNHLILNNEIALKGMTQKANSYGIRPFVISHKLSGEARIVGRQLQMQAQHNRLIMFGGETTVTVKGKGKGGRNQELVLSCIGNLPEKSCMVSIGTDGIDGPTTAAGAIIDDKTQDKGVDTALKNNDSNTYFKKNRGLIKTGITGSNVADIGLIIRDTS